MNMKYMVEPACKGKIKSSRPSSRCHLCSLIMTGAGAPDGMEEKCKVSWLGVVGKKVGGDVWGVKLCCFVEFASILR